MKVASFGAMDVNFALGLLSTLVVFTSQPYNTEGRNIICRKGLHKLQKRSSDDVVVLEGYEVTPKGEERGVDCVEYEAASPFRTFPTETTTRNQVPTTRNNMPGPTPKTPSKKQLCWVYYGKPVRLYLPMRNLPYLPNSQGNRQVFGPYTGGKNGSGNPQPRVVCGNMQRPMGSVPNVLQDYTNGNRGKQDGKGSGAVKPIAVWPVMAIQASNRRNSHFYNILRDYQRFLAAERPRESSVSSHCG